MQYREIKIEEASRISEIDAHCYIKNAWRYNEENKGYRLIKIDWTDEELPNGYEWHLQHLKETIENNGFAFGCFDGDNLVGYIAVNAEVFGIKEKYVLLDQLFISKEYRNKGIGKELIRLSFSFASKCGAKKIYICAGSSEDTIAFYQKLGCRNAKEINQQLFEEDPNDIQLVLEIGL